MIAEHTDRIAHVQIADAPGRNEPGTGTLPLERQLAALESRWLHRLGRPGVQAVHHHPESFGWLPRDRRASPPDCPTA